jgi:hypothetical protein
MAMQFMDIMKSNSKVANFATQSTLIKSEQELNYSTRLLNSQTASETSQQSKYILKVDFVDGKARFKDTRSQNSAAQDILYDKPSRSLISNVKNYK